MRGPRGNVSIGAGSVVEDGVGAVVRGGIVVEDASTPVKVYLRGGSRVEGCIQNA